MDFCTVGAYLGAMGSKTRCACVWVAVVGMASLSVHGAEEQAGGSAGCRSCHEGFYRLWATSWHGLAMQPYAPQLQGVTLAPQREAMWVGDSLYRAVVEVNDPNAGCVLETGPRARGPIASRR